MKPPPLSPDFIFESSWEVCNKVGGIYTVLSTKARTLQEHFGDGLVFIGPDIRQTGGDFLTDDHNVLTPLQPEMPLPVRIGRWNVPGQPLVILVDFRPLYSRRDDIYYEMWNHYRLDSLRACGDYHDSCLFAVAAAQVTAAVIRCRRIDPVRAVAHFNEWTLGMGLLYLRRHAREIATVFTTHATTVGRSIAGNGKPLYDCLDRYDGDQMAAELNVTAKHAVEKLAAHHADCFTAVSDITAQECARLLGKAPDVVTPNGFEPAFVPPPTEYRARREAARRQLRRIAETIYGCRLPKDLFIISTAGRYEYRNKGLDLFVQTMKTLAQRIRRPAIAFIAVPAWTRAARDDLRYALEHRLTPDKPLQMPFLTHWLHEQEHDPLIGYIRQCGLDDTADNALKIIFLPAYLTGEDGIFNRSYYDFLMASDITLYPSCYEPWGYTPLESIAFGIPAVTTNLSGFGRWAAQRTDTSSIDSGVAVVPRTDANYFQAADTIARHILDLAERTPPQLAAIRRRCRTLADDAAWPKFIAHYHEAYRQAVARRP
ncbi:MAG: glycosyltransferase [Tannerellaceae bacterium]|jgi:glycosyltransferase involved in cell wall biosynthesis|nr:glycosyltransferase [Tannerellaceae bacterium]